MPEKKTDFEKLQEERAAATLLRDELQWLVGYTNNDPDDRVINERLKKALKRAKDVKDTVAVAILEKERNAREFEKRQ